MLKKIVFLAITILIIGTAVAPLAQAQDKKKGEQLQKEAAEISTKAQARGSITPQEEQRLIEINAELIMMINPSATPAQAQAQAQTMVKQMSFTPQQRQQQTANARNKIEQVQEQQRQDDLAVQRQQQQKEELQRQERAKAADILRKWGLQKVQLPAGAIVSTNGDSSIHLEGTSDSPAARQELERQFQDLQQQIEKIIGKKMERLDNGKDYNGTLAKDKYVGISFSGYQITIYCWQSAA